jgi:hypothetical protein
MPEEIDTAYDVISNIYDCLWEMNQDETLEGNSPVEIGELLWNMSGTAITRDLLQVCDGQLEETKNLLIHEARCCIGTLQVLKHMMKVTEHVSEDIPSQS